MKITYLFILISACLLSCKEDHSSCEFEGTYETHGFNFGTKLVLRIDHSFSVTGYHYDCFGGEEQYIVDGTFSTAADRIFLSSSRFHIERYQDGSLPGKQDRKLEQDTTYALSVIYDKMQEYEDTLQVVRWNERMFILGANRGQAARRAYNGYSNSLIHLLNMINRNPKVVTNYYGNERILRNFWSKPCDDCKEEAIEKALPSEWADFVLKTPITAKVIDLKKIDSNNFDETNYTATLNVGYRDNVRPGMSFWTEKSAGRQYWVTITDVYEKTAKGFISVFGFKPELGVPLTTFDENPADFN